MGKKQILQILSADKDAFHSGQDICEQLGVSRAAVWKAINSLRDEGYEIEAVRNRGYRLLTRPDRLTAEEISAALQTSWAGCDIRFFQETGSTNQVIKKLAEDGAKEGTLAVAEMQTSGRGRLGRAWSSPAGNGIWMSLLVKPVIAPYQASMLTLVMAVSIRRAIEKITGLSCEIKWPNDIIADGKKICGILTEMSAETDRINYIVIGCGINVQNETFPEEIKEVATSVFAQTQKKTDRAALIAACLKEFESCYDLFLKTEDMTGLLDEYHEHLVNRNKRVCVLDPKGEYRGIARGINKEGELLVETADGLRSVSSGEVSVRGVYGYV